MDFPGLLSTIANEWRVIERAPFSFAVSVLLAGLLLWRMIDWYYKGSLRTSEDRLKLRGDEIAQLSRSLAKEGDVRPVESNASTLERTESSQAALYDVGLTRAQLPWMTNTPIEERQFLPAERTLNELFNMVGNVTSAQGKMVVEPYLGKWIKSHRGSQ